MFFEHTLPNGLRVVAQRLPHLHSVSVGTWIGTGSVKEEDGEAGISHFIEHMLFKGTERRNAQAIAAEMDSIGAQMNAFTAKECTCYYIKATEDRLEESLDMLGDIIGHSKLDPVELEKEKGVVLEEILMFEDTPEDIATEALNGAYYEGHALAKPILGSRESVSAFTPDDLRAYMKEHYGPGNMLIAVAGNFDEDALVDKIARHFGASVSSADKPYPNAPGRPIKRVVAREKDIEQAHVSLALPGYGAEDERYFPLVVLNNALGGNMSSRLFQKIREERGLAYSVYSYTSSYKDCGSLGLYSASNVAQARVVVELMLEELRAVRKDGITEEEFQRSKNQIKGSFILGNESSGARMSSIGKSALMYGRARSEEETLAKLEAVTMENIEEILADVLDESAMVGAFVGKNAAELEKIGELW